MKFATIGTSWITEKFISASKTVGCVDLTAVYSRNNQKAEDFAQKFNVANTFTDLEEMAKSSLFDSVYIASPNVLHYEQSKLFLLNGKNVICEKPATDTKEQYEELTHLAENRNLVYCEAIMSIHTDGFNKIKEEMNKIGNIYSAHFDYCQLSSKYGLYTEGKNPNIFNPEFHTGCLMDIGVYNLYLAAAFFGKPDKIISESIKLPNGCDASGSAILKYGDCSVTLNYSKTGQSYSYSEIIGDKGTIMFSSVSQLTGVYKVNSEEKIKLIDEEVSRDIIMQGEIEFFKNMCDSKNYNDKKYIFAKETAITVREICDKIRADNTFPF